MDYCFWALVAGGLFCWPFPEAEDPGSDACSEDLDKVKITKQKLATDGSITYDVPSCWGVWNHYHDVVVVVAIS